MPGNALAALLRIVTCAMLFDGLVPLTPFLAEQTRQSSTRIQASIAIGVIGYSAGQLVSGPLLQRTGLRVGMALSSAAVALAGLSFAASPCWAAPTPLLIAMFVANAPGSVAARASLRAAMDHLGYQRVMANLNAVLEGIEIVLPFAIIATAARFGWRWPFAAICLAVLGSALPALFGARSTCGDRAEAAPRRALVRDGSFLQPALLMMLCQAAFSAVALAKPTLLRERLGFTSAELEFTLSALALAMVLGFHASARLTRRVGESARVALGVVLLGAGALLLFHSCSIHAASFIAACACVNMAYCLLLPVATARAMNRPAADRVRASALFGFVQGAGAGSIVLAGTALPLDGLLRLALTVGCCAVAGATVACGALRRASFRRIELTQP